MAKGLKPNIENLGEEAKATILGAVLNGGTANGLLDGIQGNYGDTNKKNSSAYWYKTEQYVELNIENRVNIWRMADLTYGQFFSPLRIQRFENGYWVDRDYPQNFTPDSQDTKWTKWLTDLPAGRYKFLGVSDYRMDGEWYLENNVKPITFNKLNLENIKQNETYNPYEFIFTENGDLYGLKNRELTSIINPIQKYSQIELFNGEITQNIMCNLATSILDFDLLFIKFKNLVLKKNVMPSTMTNFTGSGYTLSEISHFATYAIYGAFDYLKKSNSPYWASGDESEFPKWFMVKFPTPTLINRLEYKTIVNSQGVAINKERPANITIQASNDGQDFITLLDNYKITTLLDKIDYQIDFKNNNQYNYYKFFINEVDSTNRNMVMIDKIYLYERTLGDKEENFLIPISLTSNNLLFNEFANIRMEVNSLEITQYKKPFNLQIIGVKKGV